MNAERRPAGSGAAWRAVALLILIWALAVLGTRPPAPLGPDAPLDAFSGARARTVLERIQGSAKPHPVDTAENAAVRGRIAQEISALGLTPEERTAFACDAWGSCATVHNLLVRLEATSDRATAKTVLLAVHFDSVGAGPGAGDDGAGVAAVLETLRALRAGGPLARTVLAWIDDGEEVGLLGAEAFAQQPEAASVGAVVNLEARGTAGQSLMFETRRDNAWVIAALARELPHPAMTSIFYTIYQYLPNDTDFSVFKRDGMQGANFAFVGEPTHYHTPLDDLEHLDPGTLQHHGENALAAVRAFAKSDLEHPPQGDAVYFDVLGRVVVRWPAASTAPLAILALVVLLLAVARLGRGGELTWMRVALAALAWLSTVLLAGAACFGLQKAVASLGGLPLVWVAHPEPVLLAIWCLPLALALACAPWLARRLGAAALWAGAWLAIGVLALALAVTLPGVSYLLLVPAFLAGLVGLSGAGRVGRLLPAAALALLVFPVAWRLWEGMGAALLPGIGALVAVVVAALLCELSEGSRSITGVALFVVLVSAGLAVVIAPRSSERPEPANLVLLDDRDTGTASVLLVGGSGVASPGLLAAAPFARPAVKQVPWFSRAVLATPAAPLAAGAPEAEVLAATSGSPRSVRLRLRSLRGADFLRLYVPAGAGLGAIRVGGHELPPSTARDRAAIQGDRFFTLFGVSAEGIEVDLTLTGPSTEALLQDVSFGLPAALRGLRLASGPEYVPIGSGDVTVVQHKIRL